MNLDDMTSPNVDTTEVAPPPQVQPNRPVAWWLHTAVLLAALLGMSFLGARAQGTHSPRGNQLVSYGITMLAEWIMVGYIVLGIRRRGTSLRDLIGGRWKSAGAALVDFSVAIGFWVVSLFVLGMIAKLIGLGGAAGVNDVKDKFGMLMPHTRAALLMFIFVSLTAGFCEEVIFRGYLQRQFTALARNEATGVVLQAIFFGLGHGYQGAPRMFMLFVYGAMFGLLALWRRSLRPGMISHAWQDSFSGVMMYVLFVVMKK